MKYLEFPLREDESAMLCAYVLDPDISFKKYKTRPAMVVCPGGAYLTLATKEGEVIAARWLGMGYQAFVVRYKHYFAKRPGEIGPEAVIDKDSHVPEQLVDLMCAMRIVHEHAAEWDIDENRIYTMGFSAGGNIVGTLAERFDDAELLARAGATTAQVKPAGTIMGYPMISAEPLCGRAMEEYPEQMRPTVGFIKRGIFGTENPTQEEYAWVDLVAHVRPDMPRTFVWHSTEDTVVNPVETLSFVRALQLAGVPCELHFYERGPHGTSLCDESSASSDVDLQPESAPWVAACKRWLDLDNPTPELCHE